MAHDLHAMLSIAEARDPGPTAAVDSRTVRSAPESRVRAGYEGHERCDRSMVHMAVDAPGRLLALHVTLADMQDRGQVANLCEARYEAAGATVDLLYVDQVHTGEEAFDEAADRGGGLRVVKRPEARMGFVLPPRRRAVERSFGGMARFRRMAPDYERLARRRRACISSQSACLCPTERLLTSKRSFRDTPQGPAVLLVRNIRCRFRDK